MKVYLFFIIYIANCLVQSIKLKTKKTNELNEIENEYGNFSKFAEDLFSDKKSNITDIFNSI